MQVLCEIQHSKGFYTRLISAISAICVMRCLFGFVDDNTQGMTHPDPKVPPKDSFEYFQKGISQYEGSLKATGSKLDASKSWYALIAHRWCQKKEKWVPITIPEAPGEIYFTEKDGTRSPMTRIEQSDHKTLLGMELALDDSQWAEVKYLREKAEEFAAQYRNGNNMERNVAWKGIMSTIWKVLQYPMAATQITMEDWDYIISPILMAGLPKSNFNRYFPRDVIFGPALYDGFGVIHPWHDQELEHIANILAECNRQSGLGKILASLLEGLRLEIGLKGYLHSWDFSKLYESVTDCWIVTVWHYCWLHQIELYDPLPQLETSRAQDVLIMEVFCADETYSAYDLKVLNTCRCKLEATSISDLAMANGTHLRPSAYSGKETIVQNFNTLNWPSQPEKLPTRYWTKWQAALRKHFLKAYDDRLELKQPLGGWLHKPDTHAKWAYKALTKTLYKRCPTGWQTYQPRHNRAGRTNSSFSATQTTYVNLPPGTRFATVAHTHNPSTVLMVSYSTAPHPPVEPPQHKTIKEIVAELPAGDAWAIEEVQWPEDECAHIAQAIIRGKCKGICDGSYKLLKGTSGYSLHGYNPKLSPKGNNRVPGAPKDQSPFRSELAGEKGIVVLVDVICRRHGITSGSVEIGLDGRSAMESVEKQGFTGIGACDRDLIEDIRAHIASLPVKFTFRWIESHQDTKYNPEQHRLDWWALQNIEMDRSAKAYWWKTQNDPLPNMSFPREGWHIWHRGYKLTRFRKHEVYERVNDHPIRQYWERKSAITNHIFPKVNWEAVGKIFSESSIGERRWFVKQATGHCATGTVMNQRHEWSHSKCPRCGLMEESPIHVCCCMAPTAVKQRDESMDKLRTAFESHVTEPNVQRLTLLRLKQFFANPGMDPSTSKLYGPWKKGCKPETLRKEPTYPPLPYGPAKALRAIHEQDLIGWYNFLLGRISTTLTQVQDDYYKTKRKRKTGLRWTIAIGKKLRNISWDMWDHRNGICHQSPEGHHEKSEHELLDEQIEQEFEQGQQGLLSQDRKLFKIKRKVKQRTLIKKREWLQSVTLARQAAEAKARIAQRNMRGERRVMASWLLRGRPNP